MLEKYYAKVKGIVHKCRKDYYLHLWEKEDCGWMITTSFMNCWILIEENYQKINKKPMNAFGRMNGLKAAKTYSES